LVGAPTGIIFEKDKLFEKNWITMCPSFLSAECRRADIIN